MINFFPLYYLFNIHIIHIKKFLVSKEDNFILVVLSETFLILLISGPLFA